jgi:hypothetical protein
LGKVDSMLQHGITVSRKWQVTPRGISANRLTVGDWRESISRNSLESDGINPLESWNHSYPSSHHLGNQTSESSAAKTDSLREGIKMNVGSIRSPYSGRAMLARSSSATHGASCPAIGSAHMRYKSIRSAMRRGIGVHVAVCDF